VKNRKRGSSRSEIAGRPAWNPQHNSLKVAVRKSGTFSLQVLAEKGKSGSLNHLGGLKKTATSCQLSD